MEEDGTRHVNAHVNALIIFCRFILLSRIHCLCKLYECLRIIWGSGYGFARSEFWNTTWHGMKKIKVCTLTNEGT